MICIEDLGFNAIALLPPPPLPNAIASPHPPQTRSHTSLSPKPDRIPSSHQNAMAPLHPAKRNRTPSSCQSQSHRLPRLNLL